MAQADSYWLKRLIADRALADRAAGEVEAEVRRAYRSQYLQAARRLDSLYAEAMRGGELRRTDLWNYLQYRKLEEDLARFCEAGSVIQRDALTKALNGVFKEVIGADPDRFDRGRFILPYSPRAVIDTAWSGESFSSRIWGNTRELAERIRGEAQQMLMGMKDPATVKQELMRDYDVSFKQASRLVDTELSYVLNKANLENYRRRGRRLLMITCLDINTCEKCKALEGEVFRTEDVPVLPIHPRCHCAYCVPKGGDEANEPTASGANLEEVYARKGVKGYGAKTWSPKGAAAPVIPASELQAKVEAAMKEAAPELAEGVRKQAGDSAGKAAESTAVAEGVRKAPEMQAAVERAARGEKNTLEGLNVGPDSDIINSEEIVKAALQEGGRHHGKYVDGMNWPKRSSIRRAYASYQKTIEEHVRKINDPEANAEDWNERSDERKRTLIRKWSKDLVRNMELREIIRYVARQRGVKIDGSDR